MSFASMHNDYLDPDMYGGWDDVPENCTDCGDELPEEESGTVVTRYEALCARCASDRIESLEAQIESLEAQLAAERGRLEWMVKHDAIVCSPGYKTPAPFSVQYNSPESKRAAGYKTKNSGHHSNWRDAIDEAMRSEARRKGDV